MHILIFKDQLDCEDDQLKEIARYTLLLPGKNLDLTTLNNAKKFRNKGNKDRHSGNSLLNLVKKLRYSYIIIL